MLTLENVRVIPNYMRWIQALCLVVWLKVAALMDWSIRTLHQTILIKDENPSKIYRGKQSGAVEACWAHNPEVRGSKPRSAIIFDFSFKFKKESSQFIIILLGLRNGIISLSVKRILSLVKVSNQSKHLWFRILWEENYFFRVQRGAFALSNCRFCERKSLTNET